MTPALAFQGSLSRGLSTIPRWVSSRACKFPQCLSLRRHLVSAAAAASTNHAVPDPVPGLTGRRMQNETASAQPFTGFLTDRFGRKHDYLRISITERCNLRCLYCMPEEGVQLSPPSQLLTSSEIYQLSSLFVRHGVTKIRLTGGEPTIRRDILPLMHSIGSLRSDGLKELCITSNGIALHRKLDSMVDAGLTGVNLSLDTLDPFQFQIMTRRNGLETVLRSINRILEMKQHGAGIKLKINCVVMRGMNEREIIPFVELGREKDLEVRFIEYMPFDGNKWSRGKMISYKEMLDIIRNKYPDIAKAQDHRNDTSKTYQIPGFAGKVGFVTSMTHNFCGTCNRLRITSDGNLKVCLFGNTEVSLRDLLRKKNGGNPIVEDLSYAMEKNVSQGKWPPESDEGEKELMNVIGMAVQRKKAQHAGMDILAHLKNRPMVLIGTRLLSDQPRPPFTRIPTHILSNTPYPYSYSYNQSNRLFSTTASSLSDPIKPGSDKLTHLTPSGDAHMVSITDKPITHRLAIATGTVHFSNPAPLTLITQKMLKKGDVLSISRIAGIMAAKRTADLIPLCHPIPLTSVSVFLYPLQPNEGKGYGGIKITSRVECDAKTGAEMEALTAVMGAALSVVDMVKGVDRDVMIEGVRCVLKKGGRSGEWRAKEWDEEGANEEMVEERKEEQRGA